MGLSSCLTFTLEDSKVLDEVQEAMKVNESLADKKNEWMTPDLLSKIAANPKLTKLFTNPEYMQVKILSERKENNLENKGNNNDAKRSKRSNGKIWRKS